MKISNEIYNKDIFDKLTSKLEQGEEEFRNGKIHDARTVFKELRKNMATNHSDLRLLK